VPIPAGIGVAPARQGGGGSAGTGHCQYPVRTRTPAGVVEVTSARPRTLGDFFAVWGQPLSHGRLLSFPGRVQAFVAGTAYRGDPRAIPLTRHAVIAVELGGAVVPHPTYLFPPGL
jgi:hypothetical protein